MERPRVLIVGGGIAGAGVGWALGDRADVILAERERHLSYHSTGRSAALYIPGYGAPNLVALSRASRHFFESPPDQLTDHPLVTPRGALFLATDADMGAMETYFEGAAPHSPGITRVTVGQAAQRCPAIRPESFAAGIWEPLAKDIDVAALHQLFVRGIRRSGGEIRTKAPLTALRRSNGGWLASVGDEEVRADIVVNAAGAWGDDVAVMAGVEPIGLRPLRRTAFMVPAPPDSRDWPLTAGISWDWYFKPDGTQLLCSPADVTLVEPHDVRPEPIDIALAIERINSITTLDIRSVRSSWAGLRTFVPDNDIAIGPDPAEPSLFWLVGQGGDGIQSSPGASTLAAALILGEPIPDPVMEAGVDATTILPARFRA